MQFLLFRFPSQAQLSLSLFWIQFYRVPHLPSQAELCSCFFSEAFACLNAQIIHILHILHKQPHSKSEPSPQEEKQSLSETPTAASEDLGEKDEYRNGDCHLSGHAPLLNTDLFTASMLLQLINQYIHKYIMMIYVVKSNKTILRILSVFSICQGH